MTWFADNTKPMYEFEVFQRANYDWFALSPVLLLLCCCELSHGLV